MARVLDVDIFNGDIADATRVVLEWCGKDGKQNRLVSATGAHGIVTAHRDAEFRSVLRSFALNLADGMPAVWTNRLKGDTRTRRCYGPDFFEAVMVASRDRAVRHYLCGGKEGVAAELQQVCVTRFHNPNVVGVYSPPFRELGEADIKQIADAINSSDADIVWIGLSTPKQETFAFRLAAYTRVHALCTVGAAFDFHTGRLKQAPHWMQMAGLEWLFRLVMEPGRLWKRYLLIVPLLIAYNTIDLVRYYWRRPGTPGGRDFE